MTRDASRDLMPKLPRQSGVTTYMYVACAQCVHRQCSVSSDIALLEAATIIRCFAIV